MLANRRTRQVDVLARFAFRCVLESYVLIENFRTDNLIDQFGALPGDQRPKAWGLRLELIRIT